MTHAERVDVYWNIGLIFASAFCLGIIVGALL